MRRRCDKAHSHDGLHLFFRSRRQCTAHFPPRPLCKHPFDTHRASTPKSVSQLILSSTQIGSKLQHFNLVNIDFIATATLTMSSSPCEAHRQAIVLLAGIASMSSRASAIAFYFSTTHADVHIVDEQPHLVARSNGKNRLFFSFFHSMKEQPAVLPRRSENR